MKPHTPPPVPAAAGWMAAALLPLAAALWGGDTLGVSLGLALGAYALCDRAIPRVGAMLLAAGRVGTDLNKPGRPPMYAPPPGRC